ncbi:MAG: hypothetical protein FWD38_11035 [Oscillospiraceae bacterium]|nr:hypothetical protein [Oscillospiraceae bacterium]
MTTDLVKKYETFWAHGDVKTPMLSITVEDKKADWEANAPKTSYDRWENLEARYKWSRFCMENTLYYGDAIATDWVNFGPGALAAMMGSNYVADENTVWFGYKEYFFKDWSNLSDLRLQKGAPMYKMVEDMTRMLTERNDGSYMVGISDLGGNLDILASLRNTEDLLADLYDYPDEVLRATEIIDEAWMEYYSMLREIIRASGQKGHITWLGPWCENSYYPLQCDFAAMISPKDFEKFVMPSLIRTSEFLGNSIFHFDGPGQIVHLDQLLSVEKMDGIQWVPGDGNAATWDNKWVPMYRKIQEAGKVLVLHGFDTIERVLNMCDQLSPKGLWLRVELKTEKEAEELLAKF